MIEPSFWSFAVAVYVTVVVELVASTVISAGNVNTGGVVSGGCSTVHCTVAPLKTTCVPGSKFILISKPTRQDPKIWFGVVSLSPQLLLV